jgi:hypothetical protein
LARVWWGRLFAFKRAAQRDPETHPQLRGQQQTYITYCILFTMPGRDLPDGCRR